jgi:sarcosine oxidase subunit gamma
MADIMTGDAMLPGRSALAGRAGMSTAAPDGGSAGLRVQEVAHIGKINIRGTKAFAKVIWNHTGCEFPPANNMVSSAGARHIVWLGPDEALLLCEAGMERDLRRKISDDLAGQHFAATNVTDALCVLQVEGPDVRAVLAKGCALDLHPKKFIPGQCAQTMLAHAGVTMIATDENCFLLICRTSFAAYTLDWLQDAALEFGFIFQG